MKQNPKKLMRALLFILFFLVCPADMLAQHNVFLTWDNETGCQTYENRKKDFIIDIGDEACLRTCERSYVNYSVGGDVANISNVAWSVTGGTATPLGLTCFVSWPGAGAGSVMATVTFTDGTILSRDFCVEIMAGPNADFTIAGSTIKEEYVTCENTIVNFTNTSTAGAGSPLVSYYWDFGDGTTSTDINPSHSYTTAGEYQVKLFVTNACGCVSAQVVALIVLKNGFNLQCASVVCEGQTGDYYIPRWLVNSCKDHGVWSVSGGEIVETYGNGIKVLWNHPDDTGFGYVTFDASACDISCITSATIKVPIILSKGTIVGPIEVCEKTQTRYSLPQWPTTTFAWELISNSSGASLLFTDQGNEIIVNTENPGTIILACTYYNTLLHCGGYAEIVIHILPSPYIQGPSVLCNNAVGDYELKDQSGNPLSGDWTLEVPGGSSVTGTGSTFSNAFTTPGIYMLTADNPNYCPTSPLSIRVIDTPAQPGFITGPTPICPGVPYIYTITNTVPGTQIGWSINPLQGSIQGSNYGNSVTVIFTGNGPYTLTAWRESLTAPYCASLRRTKTIRRINPTPQISPDNYPSEVCGSSTQTYTVDYTDGDTYNWTVNPATAGSVSGNGDSSVDVTWNQPVGGPIYLKVEITRCGQIFSDTIQVNVIASPTIAITSATPTICSGVQASFGITPLVTYSSIVWNYGDGISDSTGHHIYSQVTTGSTYSVTVTINNPNGCLTPATASFTQTVIPAPAANITPANMVLICNLNDLIGYQLHCNIQSGLGSTANIKWYYDDGTGFIEVPGTGTGNVDIDTHDYGFGDYYAIVTNTNNCTAMTNTVHIGRLCPQEDCAAPNFTINGSVTACGQITVNATLSAPPATWQWQHLGNSATTNTSTQVVFTVDTPGNYFVQYEAGYLVGGVMCIVKKKVEIIVPYIADIKYNVTCGTTSGTYNVTLLDHSVRAPIATITAYTFSVDGSPVYTGTATSFTIPGGLLPGPHTFGLSIVGDMYGTQQIACTDSESITLPALPTGLFTASSTTVCPGEPIHFDAADNGPGLTYHWDFGDGSVNLMQDPDKTFAGQTSFYTKDVILTVTNQYGCSVQSPPMTITIFPKPAYNDQIFPPNPRGCEGSSVLLTYVPVGSPAPASYQWMLGATPITGATSSTYAATLPGQYWVRVANGAGCTQNLNLLTNIATVIFVKPPVAKITGPTDMCEGEPVILSGLVNVPGVTYSWIIPGYPTTGLSEVPINLPVGVYTIGLTVGIPNGSGGQCTSSTTHTIEVHSTPAQPTLNFDISCTNYIVNINVNSPQPGTYTWSNGMNGPSISVPGGGGPYRVRYTNLGGCSITAEVDVPRNPADYLWAFPTGCYTFCNREKKDDFIITGPIAPFDEWQYLVDDVVDEAGSGFVTPYIVETSGNYQLTLDNGYCPVSSGNMSVNYIACEKCDKLEIALKDETHCFIDENHQLYWQLHLNIASGYSGPVYLTISSTNGSVVFIPTAFEIHPGPVNDILMNVYPLGTFTGGLIHLSFEADLETWDYCFSDIAFSFPECNAQRQSNPRFSGLTLAPNPTDGNTNILYSFGDSVGEKVVEVYDLLGRKMTEMTPKDAEGTLSLVSENWPSGCYIVLLKADGEVLQRQKLIIK
jgi:PKD repeat protein